MLRSLPVLAYSSILVAFVVCLVVHEPAEASLPLAGGKPQLELRAVEEFSIDGLVGLPAWSARRVVPSQSGSVLTLGGLVDALDLEEVWVDLGLPASDVSLRVTAQRGRYHDRTLSLSGGIRVDSRVVSGAAELVDGRIEFPGLVVFHHGTADEVTERGISLDYADFVARVRKL